MPLEGTVERMDPCGVWAPRRWRCTPDASTEPRPFCAASCYEILWNFAPILSERLRETNDELASLSVTGQFW